MTAESKKPWDVWLATVRFDETDDSKQRPVVVLKDNIVLCICLPVTSKAKGPLYGCRIKNTRAARLQKESWIKLEYVELEPHMFIRRLGTLDPADVRNIQGYMRSSLYGMLD